MTASVEARPLGGLGLLRADVGILALALAAIGGVAGLGRSRLRSLAAPLVLIVAIDALASLREARWISTEQLVPLHFLALASLAVGVAIGVQTIAGGMLALSLPMAKGATDLLGDDRSDTGRGGGRRRLLSSRSWPVARRRSVHRRGLRALPPGAAVWSARPHSRSGCGRRG